MYLIELFSRVLQYEFIRDYSTMIRARFATEHKDGSTNNYIVTINKDATPALELGGPDETIDDIWAVTFTMGDATAGDEDITNTGAAIQVFSTVMDIIQETIKQKNIQTIGFVATNAEPSRVKLYDRMAKKFAKSGWRYIDNREIHARSTYGDDDRLSSMYILTKQPHPHSLLKGTKHD